MKNFYKFILLLLSLFFFNFNVIAGDITNDSKGDIVNLTLKYDNKIENYSNYKVFIHIDGQKIENLNMEPIILNNRVLVPLRGVFENIGASVFWDNEKKQVSIDNQSFKITFTIGENFAIKNDTEKFLFDVPAKIINDNTMVPLRAIAEALNYDVGWDGENRIVSIMKKYLDDSLPNNELNNNQNNQSNENVKKDGIKIVWDQIGNVKANTNPSKKLPIEGLDVISPTWFAIKNENGDIEDKGSLEYSNWAKEQGYQIWGLITNSFNSKITHSVLSDKNKRTKVINDIVVLAKKYNLDGINIDFESIDKEDGIHYLAFIKEATPIFKQNNLIVSVDMYVPTKWTEHYQMAEVGKIVDYVIIMAYDEHYSTSKVSGSVSSMPWVDLHMKKATELVDKNKLIMGVPFYTRVWTETKDKNGKVSVASKSLKMDEAKELLNKNNAVIQWNEKAGQFYGEYFSEGTTKKIWLEDEVSMEERMKIARKYDVKGIAGWKRGHENNLTWSVINRYFE